MLVKAFAKPVHIVVRPQTSATAESFPPHLFLHSSTRTFHLFQEPDTSLAYHTRVANPCCLVEPAVLWLKPAKTPL